MKISRIVFYLSCMLFSFCACKEKNVKNDAPLHDGNALINYIQDVEPYTEDSLVNVVIEIPAGTNEKWEVEKAEGRLVHQIKNGQPRIIQYLPYPGNYGMIPQSILPKEKGGDGDPLDVIVLGPAVDRGTILPVKIIGVLRLLDRGEVDDKLIAVSKNSPLYKVDNIKQLNTQFPAVTEKIESWFTHYKGPDMVISHGYRDRAEAMQILTLALREYRN